MSSAKSEPTRPIGSGGGWGWVFKQSPPVFSSYWLEIDYCNFPILYYFNQKAELVILVNIGQKDGRGDREGVRGLNPI